MPQEQKPSNWLPRNELWACVGLAVVSVIIRLPFFKTFSLVSFDGTYYLNQARTLFTAAPPSGNFPVGYPFFVAIVDVVTRNTVLAGQLVSLAAGETKDFVIDVTVATTASAVQQLADEVHNLQADQPAEVHADPIPDWCAA